MSTSASIATSTSAQAAQHGLRAATVLIPGEDPQEFDSHRAAYLQRFQPADQPERDLVEAIAASRWRLNRLLQLETRLLEEENLARALSVLARYEGQLNRTCDQALKQLENLQSNRAPELQRELQSAPAGAVRKPEPNEPTRGEFEALLTSLTAPPRASAPPLRPAIVTAREHDEGPHKDGPHKHVEPAAA